MSQGIDSNFGVLRSFFWPIYRRECSKIIPMLLMVFLICFCYSILRCMKDAVIVTSAGAEVLPFIKVWALLPMAVLTTLLFTKLSNRFSQERVFYIMITSFLVFFAIFAFILYPLNNTLHPHALAKSLKAASPEGFKGLISMFQHWTFTGFYVMAELWGSIILTVLFWGFANEVTRIHEARRYYAVLGVGANLAALLAGQVGNFFSQPGAFNLNLPFGRDPWEQTVMMLITVVIFSGITVMGIFRWMNNNVLNDPSYDELHYNMKDLSKKKKLSVRESFTHLSNSKYLLCIAVLVVSYNLVMNLVEVVWKDQLRSLYSTPSDYNQYMNNLTSLVGLIATCFSFFMAKIIGRIGWTWTAMITPMIMLVTSIGFFTFLFFHDSLYDVALSLLGATPLAIVVFFGGLQNCLSKAAKYSVFDATKEMAFIPIDHESKLKGKAAIDGIGSRFGKSGGSVVHQTLLMFFGSLSLSGPYVASILMMVIFCWFLAAKSLGKQFQKLVGTDIVDADEVAVDAQAKPLASDEQVVTA